MHQKADSIWKMYAVKIHIELIWILNSSTKIMEVFDSARILYFGLLYKSFFALIKIHWNN